MYIYIYIYIYICTRILVNVVTSLSWTMFYRWLLRVMWGRESAMHQWRSRQFAVCFPWNRNRKFKRSFRADVSASWCPNCCTSAAVASCTEAEVECEHSRVWGSRVTQWSQLWEAGSWLKETSLAVQQVNSQSSHFSCSTHSFWTLLRPAVLESYLQSPALTGHSWLPWLGFSQLLYYHHYYYYFYCCLLELFRSRKPRLRT
jgi:hypothetical protein